MLIKVLGVVEALRASAALASGVGSVAGEGHWRAASPLAAVGRSLLDIVNRGEVSLEDVGAVKRLLGGRPRSGAEATDHVALVVRQGMTVLVILASKPLNVVLACRDGALLRALSLMGEHVGLEILEGLAALGIGASLLLLDLVAAVVVGGDGRNVEAAAASLAHAQAASTNTSAVSHGVGRIRAGSEAGLEGTALQVWR